ncbi:urease accessory protein UreF [Haliangium ochraceum]|uniref:Urease accessory protein UreF n=1 Tax=Haliangium ochraceum (strain DSM 14365 / JCM 11303 / SMP-2) TaxID=502025 RepID=D0LX05_HALO1|nr:urease accessory protein UreF [Haliangium ochraceum]ACY14252.1 Urease accessory protein UreF [Haliangium ochraceum DSM 14365]
MNPEALHRLMAWLSPSYPVGAFSYSHGLEWAVEAGWVGDAAALREYVSEAVREGGGHVDAVLLAHAHAAAAAMDLGRLDALIEFANAFRATAETALESHAQGRAFLRTTRQAWPDERLETLAGVVGGRLLAYPVALGMAAAELPRQPVLVAYLHAFAANLVSAGVRLVPLGQTDGQRVLADIGGLLADEAARAQRIPLDELSTGAPLLDVASMRHETQYTRLFRS